VESEAGVMRLQDFDLRIVGSSMRPNPLDHHERWTFTVDAICELASFKLERLDLGHCTKYVR